MWKSKRQTSLIFHREHLKSGIDLSVLTARALPNDRIEKLMRLAACPSTGTMQPSDHGDPDEWGESHSTAAQTLFESTSILGAVHQQIEICGEHSRLHGILNTDAESTEFAVICGESHIDCRRYFNTAVTGRSHLLSVVISRDRGNNPSWYDRPFTRPSYTDSYYAYFTNPEANVSYVAFRDLLDELYDSASPDELSSKLNELVFPRRPLQSS